MTRNEQKPLVLHPDTEASNALSAIILDRIGFTLFSRRYGTAWDFLHWLDEHRPRWRQPKLEVTDEMVKAFGTAWRMTERHQFWDQDMTPGRKTRAGLQAVLAIIEQSSGTSRLTGDSKPLRDDAFDARMIAALRDLPSADASPALEDDSRPWPDYLLD